MKEIYKKPSTYIIRIESEGVILRDSLTGSQHEGFTDSNNPPPKIDDSTDDDSPF